MFDDNDEETFWDTIGSDSYGFLKDNFKQIASKLAAFLITYVLGEDEFEIGLFKNGKVVGSNICYNQYDSDKQLELRFTNHSEFELYVMLYDDDAGKLREFHFKLIGEHLKIIPEGLKQMLIECQKEEKGRIVSAKSIIN